MKRSLFFLLLLFSFSSCSNNTDNKKAGQPVYVSPSINKKTGTFRKGYIRMPVSTDKNAYRNRIRSKYYYKTRGKYRKHSR
jgi:hypothetical protein